MPTALTFCAAVCVSSGWWDCSSIIKIPILKVVKWHVIWGHVLSMLLCYIDTISLIIRIRRKGQSVIYLATSLDTFLLNVWSASISRALCNWPPPLLNGIWSRASNSDCFVENWSKDIISQDFLDHWIPPILVYKTLIDADICSLAVIRYRNASLFYSIIDDIPHQVHS